LEERAKFGVLLLSEIGLGVVLIDNEDGKGEEVSESSLPADGVRGALGLDRGEDDLSVSDIEMLSAEFGSEDKG
jgi:hypothetical protein